MDEAKANRIVMLGLGSLLAVATIVWVVRSLDTTGDASKVDQRTCEIVRDIAASYNVTDTLADMRSRVTDLYNGYGRSASAPIATAIRAWSAGLTTGDYAAAAQGLQATSAACLAAGY